MAGIRGKKFENLPLGIGGEKLAEGRETLPAVDLQHMFAEEYKKESAAK